MKVKIALAGNPNSGKTTLFNGLTGSNQFVGNWPGVTVEKKEGKLKQHREVTIIDLPGIYSLSPYTLEEVVARNYLLGEHPDVILNIIDGTNLERNLYLTTQLMELGIPVVVAVNMMDMVEKNGDIIKIDQLSRELGCEVVTISALKGRGIMEAAHTAIEAAKQHRIIAPHLFSSAVEHVIVSIQQGILHDVPENQRRWYAIKLFERDSKVLEQLNLAPAQLTQMEKEIAAVEDAEDDDAESIVTNERYSYIASIIHSCYHKKSANKLSISDKIDRIVTNRILALPIFAAVMFVVYYVSVTTVGTMATDWFNDGVFGDGWHLFGIGSAAYDEVSEQYDEAMTVANGFIEFASDNSGNVDAVQHAMDAEAEGYDPAAAQVAMTEFAAQFSDTDSATYLVQDEETLAAEMVTSTGADLKGALTVLSAYSYEAPEASDYGIWVPGVPILVEQVLTGLHCADWLSGLILDGIVGGVGAVLGFVPQMIVLFLFLAFLEACGYMARVAFIMDRIFRRFGLSGKSFIPILIGTGCGIPGIMASRTIENEKDRRMTIMTTTFIPCGAKTPFIGMVAGAIFNGAAWVAVSAYFLGITAIICSGILLKKTKLFRGDPAPFVMELPAYHMPTIETVARSMWERSSSFIKKAGTIILLSTILVWFLSFFGWVDGQFTMLTEEQLDHSMLAALGNLICWIFAPLGFGNWQAAVASITGLIAKENIVGTMGVLYGAGEGTVYQTMGAAFTMASGYAFMAFNLLCAPCFAAMGAIRREMNSGKWFAFAIGYQCGFAYLVSLVIYQIAKVLGGEGMGLGSVAALVVIVVFVYLLFRPSEEHSEAKKKLETVKVR